ncbi:UvrD-helicase domain-containing protein [Alkalibacter rhizosphaerae]|uniref:DNA 3'-5' helicase n=1 Tax=Alkalibacter rhizosphaerae TaxID=2815577 RepID=A0A974XGT8_9FIRM|nr:UvrD-helicase domain-containing protein [Alkalibacter rhizosphaerae]QSX09521.1 UvrD-helicase domain-containing protein [Alkalibacter rhizosphaerae]
MPLILCPECENKISDRAESCPHCGLPSKYFGTSVAADDTKIEAESSQPIDLTAFRNTLIAFDHSYQTFFGSEHYITARELAGLKAAFGSWAEKLKDKTAYLYCKENAHHYAVDFEMVNICLRRYESLMQDVENHNSLHVDRIVELNADYFDELLKDIDPNIKLDDEQRKAVVTDDDYCLLVAGAGAGKTTTMAAKVKYLVEKKNVPPEDIIVISYTRKAIDELKERINKGLHIPAKICTFHAFAFDIVRKFSDTPPEVNYSAYNIIFDMLEREVFNDKTLLRKLLLFLGFYFDLPADVMNYDNLNQFHLAKAAQDYETLKSGAGDYIKKVANQRGKYMRTITGEYLRSVQEAQIANFLYLNGLDYEYEPIYHHAIRGARKKYTPDFLIRQGEHTAYLEHYAISESGYSYILTPEEIAKYRNAIKDKRKLHHQMGTSLLETWAWYKDRRPLTEHLKELLENEGFVLKERDFSEVYKKITETSKDKYVFKMVQFLMTFVAQFKTCGYDGGGFEALRAKTDNPRTHLFLDIAEPVYKYYQNQLSAQNRIDFEDMINDAHFYLGEIERQQLELPYKYIIIDEFQDIARQRFNLTKKLSEITHAKVVAVGDDWQSIFAFSGSEIGLFTRFLELMGSGVEMKITHTYRNSQELIDIAGGFVQKNVSQIQKQLISPKHLPNPVVLTEFDDSYKPDYAMAEAAEKTIECIIEEYGEDKSILLIGRYNYDNYKLCRTGHFTQLPGRGIKCEKYPKVDLTFMTAHSAKGLGFDNVILLNMFEGKFGFPCQLEDDPILKLVRFEDTSIPFAEERRLFYVALTRTKNRVYILTPQHKPSRFLIELINDYEIVHSNNLNMETVDLFRLRCPVCGYPLKYEYNKNYGMGLYLCTNEPEVCDFMTNNKVHLHDIYKCDQCKDGFMIVKAKGNDAFYGCTGYDSKTKSGCRNMRQIFVTHNQR